MSDNKRIHYLTVGQIRQLIEAIPDETPVYFREFRKERIILDNRAMFVDYIEGGKLAVIVKP